MPETRMINDFSGGIRRDVAPTSIGANECWNQVNVISRRTGELEPRRGYARMLYESTKGDTGYHLGFRIVSGVDCLKVVGGIVWFKDQLIVGCVGPPEGTSSRGAGLYRMAKRTDARWELQELESKSTGGSVPRTGLWVLDKLQDRDIRFSQVPIPFGCRRT